MLDRLRTYLYFGKRYCGVEHALEGDNEVLYVSVLKKSKKTIDVDGTFKVSTIDELQKVLPKNHPVSLVVNNSQVLSKQVESEQTDANINLEEFFYGVSSQGKIHYVSLCRKVYIESLVADYKTLGTPIIHVSLGNGSVFGIREFLDGKVYTSNACVTVTNGSITAIEKRINTITTDYDINGLRVYNTHVLSLSVALNMVIQRFSSMTNLDALVQSLRDGYLQSRFNNLMLKFGGLFILGLLMVNFLFFNHYFNAVNTLQQSSQVNQTVKQKVLELSLQVGKSQKMVEDLLKGSGSKSSFFVNAIVQSLPESILLSNLDYQPLLKRIKTDKPIDIDYGVILISGTSNKSESFSKWIAALEAFGWVDKVSVLSYEDISETVSEFNIKLDMDDDKQN